MTNKILLALIILTCLFSGGGVAEKLTVNGFFADKAILMVDGVPVILSVGEKKKGVILLETGHDSVRIKVDGKEKTLFIDQAVPQNLVTPGEYKQNATAKSHIVKARLLRQADSAATFAVEYFYNGGEAEHAWLSAKTGFRGEITRYWRHTVTPLKPGRHTTTITIGMAADAPAGYMSDTVYFDIEPVSGTKVIEFVKEWKKTPEKHESADDADGR